jgi:hypothetical protein
MTIGFDLGMARIVHLLRMPYFIQLKYIIF